MTKVAGFGFGMICNLPRRSSASGSRNHRATLYCRQADSAAAGGFQKSAADYKSGRTGADKAGSPEGHIIREQAIPACEGCL